MAAGAVALAGGLAALGLLPDAEPVWTLAPQALIGIGIALSLPGLTARALGDADPAGRRAAGTIAARHVGIVLGIVVLTPLFTAELTAQRRGRAALGHRPDPRRRALPADEDRARHGRRRRDRAHGRAPRRPLAGVLARSPRRPRAGRSTRG